MSRRGVVLHEVLLVAMILVRHQMSTPVKECLVAYIQNAPRVSFPLMATFVLADTVRQKRLVARRHKPMRQILRRRRQSSEYFTLVQEMRVGEGRDFFEYFRMSVER